MKPTLKLWTIYRRPKDMPGVEYVIRPHAIMPNGTHGPLVEFATAATLEEARSKVPPGLYNIGREAGDDPVIVETWV